MSIRSFARRPPRNLGTRIQEAPKTQANRADGAEWGKRTWLLALFEPTPLSFRGPSEIRQHVRGVDPNQRKRTAMMARANGRTWLAAVLGAGASAVALGYVGFGCAGSEKNSGVAQSTLPEG